MQFLIECVFTEKPAASSRFKQPNFIVFPFLRYRRGHHFDRGPRLLRLRLLEGQTCLHQNTLWYVNWVSFFKHFPETNEFAMTRKRYYYWWQLERKCLTRHFRFCFMRKILFHIIILPGSDQEVNYRWPDKASLAGTTIKPANTIPRPFS